MRKSLAMWLLGMICCISVTAQAADLALSYNQGPMYAMDWDGIDDMNGDGSLQFNNMGEQQMATLKILCNSEPGYRITFHSQNALNTNTGLLVNGMHSVPYTVMMDTSGILGANIDLSSFVLNDPSMPSVDVNFFGGVLPLDGATQANEIMLTISLPPFDGILRPVGIYADVITATLALN